MAKICKTYKDKYPLVQIALHTATADTVYEMMNKGLVDIALFLEPMDTEGLDYIRISDCDHWCVGMRPDDSLAEKEFIRKEDLIGKPLILPERMNVQSELANWFGKDFSKLQIAFTSNLGTNAGVMAANGLGYPISIEGAAKYWREDILVQRRISPEITTSTVIAWLLSFQKHPDLLLQFRVRLSGFYNDHGKLLRVFYSAAVSISRSRFTISMALTAQS